MSGAEPEDEAVRSWNLTSVPAERVSLQAMEERTTPEDSELKGEDVRVCSEVS